MICNLPSLWARWLQWMIQWKLNLLRGPVNIQKSKGIWSWSNFGIICVAATFPSNKYERWLSLLLSLLLFCCRRCHCCRRGCHCCRRCHCCRIIAVVVIVDVVVIVVISQYRCCQCCHCWSKLNWEIKDFCQECWIIFWEIDCCRLILQKVIRPGHIASAGHRCQEHIQTMMSFFSSRKRPPKFYSLRTRAGKYIFSAFFEVQLTVCYCTGPSGQNASRFADKNF